MGLYGRNKIKSDYYTRGNFWSKTRNKFCIKIYYKIPILKIEHFKDKLSIVDTDSSYIYIGYIIGNEKEYVVMKDVDVHDTKTGSSTKEQYIITAKKIGTKPNRKKVYILKDKVISISSIDDVIEY